MTRNQHKQLWQDPVYVRRVQIMAEVLKADGCTGVPDFYLNGCLEHDIAYKIHRDHLGRKITKRTADKRFRWYIQHHSPFGMYSPMAWCRWLAVTVFGHRAWNHK